MLFKPFSRDLFANNHSVNYGGFQKVLGNCKKQDKMIHKCFIVKWFLQKKYLKILKSEKWTDKMIHKCFIVKWFLQKKYLKILKSEKWT